jgi:hypothetical protein
VGNPETIQEQLRPYSENIDCLKEDEMEFDDQTSIIEDEWEKGGEDRVVMPDGTLLLPYDEQFRVPGTFGIGSTTHNPPKHLIKEISNKKLYESIEHYAEDYHGLTRNNAGQFGYYSNPNRRWDWYEIGGRWSGLLIPKPGAKGTYKGRPGVFGENPRNLKNGVDSIKIKDVDWDLMERKNLDDAMQCWKEFIDSLKENYPTNWQEVACKGDFIRGIEPAPTFDELYEKYINDIEISFSTYALLKDKVWYQRGEMGWFGVSTAEMEKTQWTAFFKQTLDNLDPETYITIVDCHI